MGCRALAIAVRWIERCGSLGANLGATRPNDFVRPADERGQPSGNHPRWRTDLDDAERDTGNYGLGVVCVARLSSTARGLRESAPNREEQTSKPYRRGHGPTATPAVSVQQ
jgi:hypothetical protein